MNACRVCLITDCKLYSLDKRGLAQMFRDCTSLPMSPSDGLPQYICYICCALLIKYAAFRRRCHDTYNLSKDMRNMKRLITPHLLSSIKKCLINLKVTKVDEYDYENSIDIRYVDEEYIEMNHENKYDPMFEADNNFSKDDETKDTNCSIDDDIVTKKDEGDISVDRNTVFVPIEDIFSYTTNINALSKEDSSIIDSVVIKTNDKKATLKRIKNIEKNSTKIKRKDIKIEFNESEEGKSLPTKAIKRTTNINKSTKKTEFAKKCNMKISFINKEDQIKEVSARKECDSYKKARFKCEICYKGFATDTAFNNHKIVHDPKRGKFSCDLCKIYFPKKGACYRHLEEHRVKYTCEQCGDTFTNTHLVRTHFKYHSGVQYECEACKKSFRKITTYYNHVRNSHASVACALCGDCFVGEQGLKQHMQRSHLESLNAVCPICSIQFLSEDALSRHTTIGCTSGIKPCTRCGDGLESEALLNKHLELVHKAKTFICDECNKTFSQEHHLGVHWNNMHSDKKRTKTRKRTSKDVSKDNQMPTFMCDQCGKSFKGRTAFVFHTRLHTGEKPHQCPVCPKTFRLPYSLKIHLTTHTDERPYPCSLCPRAFRQDTHRRAHMFTHTQEKPHACNICEKRFSLRINLREHERAVHAGLPSRRSRRTRTANKKPFKPSDQDINF